MRTPETVYGLGGYDPAKPNDNVVLERELITPGLGASCASVSANGVDSVVFHYARYESGTVVWIVNKEAHPAHELTESEGLWVAELEVTTNYAGPVEVEVDGQTLIVQAHE